MLLCPKHNKACRKTAGFVVNLEHSCCFQKNKLILFRWCAILWVSHSRRHYAGLYHPNRISIQIWRIGSIRPASLCPREDPRCRVSWPVLSHPSRCRASRGSAAPARQDCPGTVRLSLRFHR